MNKVDEAGLEAAIEAYRATATYPIVPVEALTSAIAAYQAKGGEVDYFGSLVEKARAAAAKASIKFPQPNYVTLKIAEEAGEVVRGAVHYAENRMEWSEVEGEIVQLLAMLIRFVTEGDQINGVTPPPHALTSPSAIKGLKIDREALRRQIERDPDEGEIGVGFELADLDEMERLAMAALPAWARDEILRLRALTSPPKAEAGEPEPFAWYLTGIDGRMSQVSDRIGDRDAWLSIGYVVKPLYATPEPRGDVRVTDELIGTALIAWDKLAGYSKIERMRAALEAVLNPGATTP